MDGWTEIRGAGLRWRLRPGKGPTLVLIHEMGGSLESWERTLAALPPQLRVLRYDTRGAGLSEKLVGPCTLDTHADDLAGLLQALDIQGPVALAGIAVGAAIAVRFATRHAGRASHVLALAPAAGVAEPARAATRALADRIVAEGVRSAAEGLLLRAVPEALRTAQAGWPDYRLRWLAGDGRSLGQILHMLASFTLDAELAGLPTHTGLVGGSLDALRPPAEIARLSALAPRAQSLVVPTGHMMATHSPLLLAALIGGFVAHDTPLERLAAEFLAHGAHWSDDRAHAL
ncbi:alpha/beta fold hydrolase [Pseudorhodoferax sp. LjRoot39]|uniref:alpha/beta fold hydrolase n=1 Tax=Pseudorhodoferax sp. LjRoot39 TaxID=3342328 RepID=UPI003ECC6B70